MTKMNNHLLKSRRHVSLIRKLTLFHILFFTLQFKAAIEDDNDRHETIMKKLNEMSKREVRNGAKIQAIARKLMEEEHSEEFNFPLRTEPENEKLEKCLYMPKFTKKLVSYFCVYQ